MPRKNKQKPSSSMPSACDWTPGSQGDSNLSQGAAQSANQSAQSSRIKTGLRTRLHRHKGGCVWNGVEDEQYKSADGTWSDVVRRSLAGMKGERTRFHLRYFEVAPGGHTTLERHVHEHVVVALRGSGRATVKGRDYELRYLDTLYIPPDAPHQLVNTGAEPFGFLCIVDAERDRPVVIEEFELD